MPRSIAVGARKLLGIRQKLQYAKCLARLAKEATLGAPDFGDHDEVTIELPNCAESSQTMESNERL